MIGQEKKLYIFTAFQYITGIKEDLIMGKSREDQIVKARQMLCYYLYEFESMSYASIGRFMGLDHSTVIHSVNKIKGSLGCRQIVDNIVDKISTYTQG